MHTRTNPDITLIIIGSEGFIGQKLVLECIKISPKEIFLVDPKSSSDKLSNSKVKIYKCESFKELIARISESKVRRSSRNFQNRVIILNSSGTSIKGKFESDLIEIKKFNLNLEIITDICNLIDFLHTEEFFNSILLCHLSTNAIMYEKNKSSYEHSKIVQEDVLHSFMNCLRSNRVSLIITRLSDVYGDVDFHLNKVVNKMIINTRSNSRLSFINRSIYLRPIHVDFVALQLIGLIKIFSKNNFPLFQLISLDSKFVFKIKEIQTITILMSRVSNFLVYFQYYILFKAKFRFYFLNIKNRGTFLNTSAKKFLDGASSYDTYYDDSEFFSFLYKEIIDE